MIGKGLLLILFRWWFIWKLYKWRCVLKCRVKLLTILTWWLLYHRLSGLRLFCRLVRLKLMLDLCLKILSARITRLNVLIVLLLTLGPTWKPLKRIANLRPLKLRSVISVQLTLAAIWVHLMHLFDLFVVNGYSLDTCSQGKPFVVIIPTWERNVCSG